MTVLEAYPVCREVFCGVREESGGQYVTCDCVLKCHTTARLRLWLGRDGRLMFGCYANCPKLEILRAVGLSWKDTFPDGAKIERQHQEITARYPYCDETGALLYQTVRLEPGRGGRDKEFIQRRPNPAFDPKRPLAAENRKWVNSIADVRRVLYRLPELLRADRSQPVFVVAGEKDAESLRAIGLVATTNVCGETWSAGAWLRSYSESLAGRHVVVIEDADDTGYRHANEKAGSLLEHVSTLRRLTLPGAKDATAFISAHRIMGATKPAEQRAALFTAVNQARLWSGV